MSPEQASGKSRLVGPLSDVYSLGAVLYALLTSRAPFVGETPSHTIMQVLQNEPLSPRKLNPSVPRDLETICLKCLEKEPHKRYGSAQLLADDLGLFQEGKPVKARPVNSIEQGWRWCRRNSVIASLSATLFVSLLIGVGASWYLKFKSEDIGAENLILTIAEAAARDIAAQSIMDEKKALQEKEQAFKDTEEKTRQLAQRNYLSKLVLAPNLHRYGRISDLRDLLNEAKSLNLNDFSAAYWSAKLKEESSLASATLPGGRLVFSSDGQWVASVRTHTDDVNLPKTRYKRQVADLYRVLYSPEVLPQIQLEFKKTLELPSFSDIAFFTGAHMLALADKGYVKLLDLDSGELSKAFETKYTMYGVRNFSAMGTHLLNYDGDEDRWELLSLYDRTAKSLPKLKAFSSQEARIAVSNDGRFVASTTGLVIQVDGGKRIMQFEDFTKCWKVQFSPDNSFLCASKQLQTGGSVLSFLNLANGDEIFTLPNVSSYTFSQSDPKICFAVSSGVLHRVNLEQKSSTQRVSIGQGVTLLSLIPGNESIVLGLSHGQLCLWQTFKPAPTKTLEFTYDIRAISANRRYAVVPGRDRKIVEIWDLFEQRKIADMTEPNLLLPNRSTQRPELVTYAVSDDALVASHIHQQNQVMLFDARQNKQAESWEPDIKMPPLTGKKVGITPNGKTILLSEQGFLHGTTFQQREAWTLRSFTSNINAFDVSADSKWLIIDRKVWSLDSRRETRSSSVIEASFSPPGISGGNWVGLNGETWLAGSQLGEFFNPETGKLRRFAMSGHYSHDYNFTGLAISSDGRNLALVGTGAAVQVFLVLGSEQAPSLWPVLEIKASPGNKCAFKPDNRTLLSIGSNSVTYIHADTSLK